MRPEELMIGDYARVNRDGLCIKKDTIVEIREIDANNKFANHIGCASCRPLDDMQYENGIWCDYLDPIPLTPEILEKNGFKQYGWTGWWLEDDYYNVNAHEISDSIWVVRYECTEMNTPYTQATIGYIHELQHALRLCGIEKEIVL